MKTILTILFIGFLNTQAQPKNTNTIIVKDVTFDQIAQTLTDQNIAIKNKDAQTGTITTDAIKYRKGSGTMALFIRVKDSTAYISGTFDPQVTIFNQHSSIYQIEYRGWKGSDLLLAFQRMQAIAEGLRAEIYYAKL